LFRVRSTKAAASFSAGVFPGVSSPRYEVKLGKSAAIAACVIAWQSP
jgi:hypothetical protein